MFKIPEEILKPWCFHSIEDELFEQVTIRRCGGQLALSNKYDEMFEKRTPAYYIWLSACARVKSNSDLNLKNMNSYIQEISQRLNCSKEKALQYINQYAFNFILDDMLEIYFQGKKVDKSIFVKMN